MQIFPLFPFNSPDQWSAFGTGITGWATVGLVIVAYLGLKQWRIQLMGTSKYEVARRLALLGLQFRDEFNYVRNPFTFADESAGRTRAEGETETQARINDEYYAHRKRLTSLQETFIKLRAISWEAEIIVGEDVQEYIKPLERIYGELFAAIQTYFSDALMRDEQAARSGRDAGIIPVEERDEVIRQRRMIYYTGGEDDELNRKLEEATRSLKKYLQTFMK